MVVLTLVIPTLWKHAWREQAIYLGLALGLVSGLLLLQRVLLLSKLVITLGYDLWGVLGLLLYSIPRAINEALAIAMLCSVYVVLARQRSDAEQVAMFALGARPWGYAAPFLIFALGICGLQFGLTLWGQPWSIRQGELLQQNLFRERTERLLEPGTPQLDLAEKMIWLGQRSEKNAFEQILLTDRVLDAQSALISAQRGRIRIDEAQHDVHLEFEDGQIVPLAPHHPGPYRIEFQTLRYALSLERRAVFSSHRSALSLSELREGLRRFRPSEAVRSRYQYELGLRYVVPFNVLAMVMAAFPLFLTAYHPRIARWRGPLVLLLWLVAYYLPWSALGSLMLKGLLDARWLPLIPLGALSLAAICFQWRIRRLGA